MSTCSNFLIQNPYLIHEIHLYIHPQALHIKHLHILELYNTLGATRPSRIPTLASGIPNLKSLSHILMIILLEFWLSGLLSDPQLLPPYDYVFLLSPSSLFMLIFSLPLFFFLLFSFFLFFSLCFFPVLLLLLYAFFTHFSLFFMPFFSSFCFFYAFFPSSCIFMLFFSFLFFIFLFEKKETLPLSYKWSETENLMYVDNFLFANH